MAEVRADTAQYVCKIAGTTFQVLSFSGHEEMSELFGYNLTLWSRDSAVDIASLIRQNAEITLTWGGKTKQYFGIVAHMAQVDARLPGLGGADQEQGIYTVDVVPTLWLLARHRHCRIFQKKSADTIIKQVLDERGMSGKYDPKMGGYPEREYCVQYRETDLAFISRLMQEEGIFYYFTHDGKEMMVLGDQAGHYGTCAPDAGVQYKTPTGDLAPAEEYLSGLTYEESAYTGKVKYKDFDYRDPPKPLRVEQTAPGNTDLEIYDYNVERYRDDGRGRSLAKVAVDAEAAMRKLLAASGDWRSASAGCVMTLSRAYRSDLNGDWVLLSVDHSASQEADTGVQYSVSLTAVRKDPVFRSAQSIPKPFINLQTATVVGPGDAKIYMDDLGRAKVQFHWDPDGQNNENSSCWVRVTTSYAGMDASSSKKHGVQFHPLIGDEVVVDFLDGDPDNPLIVGSVYNGDKRPVVQPTELVRNRILTPYQHQLLLDDKGAAITLSTGGNERLVLTDKNESDGNVLLSTRGNQIVHLEDHSDAGGNAILIATVDEHMIQLSEKDQVRGIQAKTKNRNRLNLNDTDREIKICTENDNQILLQDDQRFIEVKTTDGRRLRLSDQDERIELSSVNMHYLVLDDSGDRIVLASGDNSLKLEFDVGGGTITLHAVGGDIHLVADNNLTLHGGSVSIVADNQLELRAGTLDAMSNGEVSIEAGSSASVHATGNLDLSADGNASVSGNLEASLEGQVKASVTGALVDVSGTGVVTIQGALVKIN